MASYVVWCPELGSGPEDGRKIKASDAEEAASIWAKREDAESADYWIVRGDGTTVMVRNEYGTDKAVSVRGERYIEYYAREVLTNPAPDCGEAGHPNACGNAACIVAGLVTPNV